MSILAEKRHRKSWVLNPRSTAWTQDSSKFGQRMLEKMGWSPGKGLGANEQGMVDILRIKYKNDLKGLGCEKKVEDWIKTQENFNSILEELGVDDQEKKVGEKSLELTSKAIKKRVHYHKFARGKDLSRYSSKDLRCILGVNVVDAAPEIQNDINEDNVLDVRNDQDKTVTEEASCEIEVREECKKNKKRKRKLCDSDSNDVNVSKLVNNAPEVENITNEDDVFDGRNDQDKTVTEETSCEIEVREKCKKKSKKRKRKLCDSDSNNVVNVSELVNNDEDDVLDGRNDPDKTVTEETSCEIEVREKCKKKSKKRKRKLCDSGCNNVDYNTTVN